jgi:hypothetical protein
MFFLFDLIFPWKGGMVISHDKNTPESGFGMYSRGVRLLLVEAF